VQAAPLSPWDAKYKACAVAQQVDTDEYIPISASIALYIIPLMWTSRIESCPKTGFHQLKEE
jgi:hypothetical protein